MKTLVKICGLTRLEDARFCAAAGADYLGFVLAKESPRFITPDKVKEIIGWVYGPKTVGVFVDADPSYVNEIAQEIGFDLVQLHGNESVEECRRIDAPIIKAIAVRPDTTAADLEMEIGRYGDSIRHVLLDTSIRGVSGGTGQTFDWAVATDTVRRHDTFVAGGVNSGNVVRVIQHLDPFAIDVATGVEDSPGIKDFEKVSTLLETVAGLAT